MRPLLALLCATAAAAAPYSAPPFPHEHSDLPADPSVRWGKLENGVRYALLRNTEPPGRLSLRMRIATGSLNEEENQRGIAHFIEHMAFNGSKHFKAAELIEILQQNGIGFGGDLNAYTGFDETVYMLDLPRTDDELVGKCLLILRDWADGLLLAEDEIDKERGVILAEKRDHDSVEMRLLEEKFKTILPEALVGNRIPIGTEEVIAKAPRERFLAYYTGNYTPERITVVVAGDIDLDAMEKKVREQFDGMVPPTAQQPPPDLGRVKDTGLLFRNFSDNEVKSVDADIVSVRPFTPKPDTKAERARRLPLVLADSMLNRRLEILVKKEGSGVLECQASADEFIKSVEIANISATADGDDWGKALAMAEQELRRALDHGFTPAEFDEAKANLVRAYEEAVKTKATRKSESLAMGLVRSLNGGKVFTSPETELEWLKETLPGVTVEACHNAFKEVWSGGGRAVTVTTKQPLANGEAAIRQAYEASQAVPVEANKTEAGLVFAYKEVGPAGTVAERKEVADLGITQWVLSNRVRVNFKPTDFEKNSIQVLARFGGGKLDQPLDKPGLDVFAQIVFNVGGLVAHSADDLDRLFAGKKLGVEFEVDEDAFTLAGTTTREDLLDQLRLLCAYLRFPGYRDEAERQFRKMLPILAMQMTTTPEGVFGTRGQRVIMGGDPRFGLDDPMKLGTYQTREVKDWLAPFLDQAALEVSIVGDFDPATLEPAVLATLGALPPRQPTRPDYAQARVVPPMAPGPYRLEYQSKIPKALNLVVWPTCDRSDIRKARRLSVLGSVLGDRLRIKIREELGEAYSPRAGSQNSDTFKDVGHVISLSPGDPEKSPEVVARIRAIADDLARDGATEEEFQRALKPVLSNLEVQLRENDYWLGSVLARCQEKPATLDWCRTLKQDFSSVTLEEVNALARDYLGKDRAREIIITTPEKAADDKTPKAEVKQAA